MSEINTSAVSLQRPRKACDAPVSEGTVALGGQVTEEASVGSLFYFFPASAPCVQTAGRETRRETGRERSLRGSTRLSLFFN